MDWNEIENWPESGITEEDVKEWRDSQITRQFLMRIKLRIDDEDKHIHNDLRENKKDEAALSNAGKVMLEEILDEVQRMINELGEE